MQFDNEATICAIATGHQNGFRGAVRVTGWTAFSVIEKLQTLPVSLKNAKRPIRVTIDWNLEPPLGFISVDLWYWPTKRSYTGMPSVELHTFGNQVILKRMIEQLCLAGARLAMPGEFTLRAFLAGRMDLTQCEAVLGVIEAESQDALEVALRQLAGGLSEPLAIIRTSLIELLADLEAGLDFVDEDIEFISREQVLDRLSKTHTIVTELYRQINQRQQSSHAPRVALLGLPNAGKSSLINALTDTNVAIVNAQAGTTRDYVRARCELIHGEVDLVDTAGMELNTTLESNRSIHDSAQRHTQEQRNEADLILFCIDSQLTQEQKIEELRIAYEFAGENFDRNFGESDRQVRRFKPNVWVVWTKFDLFVSAVKQDTVKKLELSLPAFITSCWNTQGLDSLRLALDSWLIERDEESSSVAPMTAARCKESLAFALESLQAAESAAEENRGEEIVASEIRLSLEHLAQVAGQVYTDDVLDALFSRFCIGK